MPRAAITNSRSRNSSNRARTMRASTGHDSSEITRIVGAMPCPATEARTSKRTTGGNVIARSITRIATALATLPPSAATAPIRKPITMETPTALQATVREMRPPSRTRASTSRPTPSVPSQCSVPGGALSAVRSIAFGSMPSTRPCDNTGNTTASNRTRPAIAIGLPAKRPAACASGWARHVASALIATRSADRSRRRANRSAG